MNRRFNNTDEYKTALAAINPNIEVLEPYIDTGHKILHKCKIHNINYYALPESTLHGKGCPQCHFDKISNAKTKTHEWYLNELKIKNPNVVPVDKYVDMRTHITHKCLIHQIEWQTTPSNVLKGCGCHQCLKERIHQANTKSNEQYLNELKTRCINILPLEQYQHAGINILHRCLKCSYEWKVRPSNILSGKGCPKCARNLKRTHEQYVQTLQTLNPNIIVLGRYIKSSTPIKHKCKRHNYIWDVAPVSILNGTSCYYCGLEKLSQQFTKTQQDFVRELQAINCNIICLGEYINNNTKIKVKCLKCNNEWMAYPTNLLRGSGCPNCCQSKGEKQVEHWLQKHKFIYEPQKEFQDCKDVRILRFDFFLPKQNACIEYDGKQHFQAIDYFGGDDRLLYTQYHDQIKTDYCRAHNIPLLRIPYYANVDEELKNFLLN